MSGLDVLTARVAFRDRSTIDVFDLALRFTVVHARAYVRLAAIVLLPVTVAAVAIGSFAGWTLAWVFAAGAFLVAQIPYTLLASRLVFEREVTTASIVRATFREAPRLLAMRAAWAVAMVAGLVLLVIPALWVAGSLHFMSEVMLLERAGIVSAFGRSQRVASASLGESLAGASLGLLFVALGIVLGELAGRAIVGDLLEFRPPPSAWVAGGSAFTMIGLFGVLPFVTTARFFTYLNVRTRVEGWDIQTKFAALAARAQIDGMEPRR